MNGLLRSVDNAFLVQIDNAVGDHFRVDTQIFLIPQAAQHRIGDRSNTELQSGAVLNQAGAISADGRLHISHLCRG